MTYISCDVAYIKPIPKVVVMYFWYDVTSDRQMRFSNQKLCTVSDVTSLTIGK